MGTQGRNGMVRDIAEEKCSTHGNQEVEQREECPQEISFQRDIFGDPHPPAGSHLPTAQSVMNRNEFTH